MALEQAKTASKQGKKASTTAKARIIGITETKATERIEGRSQSLLVTPSLKIQGTRYTEAVSKGTSAAAPI